MSLRRLFTYNLSYGPIAQLVEQRTFNPWVEGSSPSGPTCLSGMGFAHPTQTFNGSGDSDPRRNRALAATAGSMSQRENGEGGIKAMPSGHCAAETPNRKSPSGPALPALLQNLKPHIFLDTIFGTIFDGHFGRIFVIGSTSTAPVLGAAVHGFGVSQIRRAHLECPSGHTHNPNPDRSTQPARKH